MWEERINLKLKNEQPKDASIKKKSSLRENIEAILIAIVLALFIRTFVVQAFKIPSGSMQNTLQIGDHILVNKFLYGVKIPFIQKTIIPITNPKKGDIVVFKFPEDPKKDFIKRVIGVSGDVIKIENKQLYINHKPAQAGYTIFTDPHILAAGVQPRDNYGPQKVPPDSLFVMGDNRDQSYDSRFWDYVKLKDIKGKAFMIYWSWDKDRFGVRWKRLGNLIR